MEFWILDTQGGHISYLVVLDKPQSWGPFLLAGLTKISFFGHFVALDGPQSLNLDCFLTSYVGIGIRKPCQSVFDIKYKPLRGQKSLFGSLFSNHACRPRTTRNLSANIFHWFELFIENLPEKRPKSTFEQDLTPWVSTGIQAPKPPDFQVSPYNYSDRPSSPICTNLR